MEDPRLANAIAAAWYPRRTSSWSDWELDQLLTDKGSQRISVVIPARDEAETIGAIVTGIRTDFVDGCPLVDELVVIDSDSADDTAKVAARAGAVVRSAREIRPDLGGYAGKGEALWKAQFVTSGDLLVFIDADLTGWGTHFVSGLVGPLVADDGVQLVKGFYDRVLADDRPGQGSPRGGRVTELVARPVLNLYWPELARIVQPLAGEWAIRRAAFGRVSVPVGYGVEIAALLDVYAQHGLDSVTQVDLGARTHSHQSVHDLAVMAAEIIAAAQRRCTRSAAERSTAKCLWQYDRTTGWRARRVPLAERPPAVIVESAAC